MKTLNQFLLSKFNAIKVTNPRFSLRALAQKSNISPGHLSEILTGKRGLTVKNLEKLITALRLAPDDVTTAYRYFDSEKARKKATQSIEKVLTKNEFAEISGTEFFLVLAAMDLSIDNLDIASVAKKTGLSEEHIENVINKFVKMGILEKNDDGALNKSLRSLSTESEIPNFDIQRFHKDALDRTKSVFAEVATNKREMVYMTMAINPKNLPQAKKEIEKCWKKVYTKLSQGERTEIYSLGIQLVPAHTGKEK
ncbi:TIGR02147 family protein [Bdellovibrio sp. 22V]|uniref:TIGR02147 family protein n=1 Tax=Bdellovibrio sp. 22V TaxID=3044166 RepID=UPI002543D891|nr:TIGR02147 family protein [Bdellovibrio sp. 22V]WII73940.1 TIGR02147 family protein [Bdellovibrio sp. 22V]